MLPEELHEWLRKFAYQNKTSLAKVVKSAIEQFKFMVNGNGGEKHE